MRTGGFGDKLHDSHAIFMLIAWKMAYNKVDLVGAADAEIRSLCGRIRI